ncbi:MAG: DUF309 domain-containing protein [Desulfobulbaceae bacterium]
MATTFEPFQDRLSRDIRNDLSTAFIKAVALLDPEPVRRTATQYLEQAAGECYREYIEERLRRYEKALARFRREPSAVLWQAAVLWDLQLFFEVHELLEQAWLKAAGDEKLVLQALIRAAGVYIKLEYGYRDAALKMAGHALPVLAAHRETLSHFFDPAPLLQALASPSLPPPQLLD